VSFAFNIPLRGNEKLGHIIGEISRDVKLNELLKCSNIMAVDRMGYTDHGPTHVRIVANSALKLLRMLTAEGLVPSIVSDYGMEGKDAEVVVVLGAVFHDLGMIVAREAHERYSVQLAPEFIERYLQPIYTERERAIILSEVLHALVMHDSLKKPLTVEAGVLQIADALDMEQGRARIPFERGRIDIHSVSALSIENVDIMEGEAGGKPIVIRITMSNSAGIFQIDELLRPRIENSGLRQYIKVEAEITGESERRILGRFEI